MNGPNSDTFGITTLSITLFNFWVRLALGKIVYCENTNTSSHILIVNTLWIFLVRNETEIILSVLAEDALYYQNKQCFGTKVRSNLIPWL